MKSDLLSRRHFLKASAYGALGTMLLNQKAMAFPKGLSVNALSVFGLIDITQSLADGDITENIYWADNNRLNGSTNEGSNKLITKANKGDTIYWMLIGLEVETSAYINNITGPAASVCNPKLDDKTSLGAWVGEINATASGLYEYTIELMVEDIPMSMSTPLTLDIS